MIASKYNYFAGFHNYSCTATQGGSVSMRPHVHIRGGTNSRSRVYLRVQCSKFSYEDKSLLLAAYSSTELPPLLVKVYV